MVWCSGGHSYVKKGWPGAVVGFFTSIRDGLVQWWASLRQKRMACCSGGHCYFNKGWSAAGMGIVTSKKDGLVQWWALLPQKGGFGALMGDFTLKKECYVAVVGNGH